jgi:hypothetical protein
MFFKDSSKINIKSRAKSLKESGQGGYVSTLASLRSPDGRFYCVGRKRGFILKFKEVKRFFFLFYLLRLGTPVFLSGGQREESVVTW